MKMRNMWLLAAAFFTTFALAKGEQPESGDVQSQHQYQYGWQENEQVSVQDTVSQGGASRAESSADSYNALTGIGNTSDNSKFISLKFPTPVWAQLPPAVGCIVSKQEGRAAGWNFISKVDAGQQTDFPCLGHLMAREAYMQCQFETSYEIGNRVYKYLVKRDTGTEPQDLPKAPGTVNMSIEQCEMLRNPRLQATPVLQLTAAPKESPAAVAECVQEPPPATPKASGTPAAKNAAKPRKRCK